MYNPLVSIIIPVYNGSNYLAEAIDSALAQTYKNIEILVINDGSKDDGETEKVALSYGDKIRYFFKENGGVSTALNMGIENMKGEWFSWLSHDDLYMPQKIELQISKVKENQKDTTIVLCYGSLMDSNQNDIYYIQKTINESLNGLSLFKHFLNGYQLNGLGFLIPKAVLDEVGNFNENMRYLQDIDYWLRLMQKDYRFICHKDLLVKNRIHSAQVTNNQSNLFDKDRVDMVRNHITVLSKNNDEKSKQFIELYYYLCVKGGNKIGVEMAKKVLSEKGQYTIFVYVKSLKYRLKKILLNILRLGFKTFFIRNSRNKNTMAKRVTKNSR